MGFDHEKCCLPTAVPCLDLGISRVLRCPMLQKPHYFQPSTAFCYCFGFSCLETRGSKFRTAPQKRLAVFSGHNYVLWKPDLFCHHTLRDWSESLRLPEMGSHRVYMRKTCPGRKLILFLKPFQVLFPQSLPHSLVLFILAAYVVLGHIFFHPKLPFWVEPKLQSELFAKPCEHSGTENRATGFKHATDLELHLL